MDILAANKTNNEFHYETTWAAYQGRCSIVFCLILIGMSCLEIAKSADAKWIAALLLLTFLSLLAALYNLEIYLLNRRAVETVSVQHEMLVVEYRNLIFRRRKEIPLSAISGVERLDDDSRNVWHPYMLRIIHSGAQSCRLGIGMTPEAAKTLAGEITALAQQYI